MQRLLARGWLPRLVACCVVAAAAIVWLGVALAVLRLVVFTAAVLAFAWCGWLVATVWRNAPPGTDSPPWAPDRVWARLRRLGDRSDEPRRDDEAATVAAVRASTDALTAELLGRQDRLNADAERLQGELAGQIETMRTLVARIGELEHELARLAQTRVVERPVIEAHLPAPSPAPVQAAGSDEALDTIFDELEADLRLESIEERERTLSERERRLERREKDLAAFVAQTQVRLS